MIQIEFVVPVVGSGRSTGMDPLVDIQLPWPPATLSPNARLHWAMAYRAKAKYRDHCWAIARDQSVPTLSPHEKYDLSLRFVPPDRRSYDRDNLIARMKAGLDGLADALMIDDKQFTRLSAEVSADSLGSFVHVRIYRNSQGDGNASKDV